MNAGADGIPSIASDVGGIAEIFHDNESKMIWGITVNNPDEISDKIMELISDENFYLNISREQYENITKRFSISKMVNEFWNLYMNLYEKQ